MKNYLKIHFTFILLALAMILGQNAFCQNSYAVITSKGSVSNISGPGIFIDTIYFAFDQVAPPFCNSMTFTFQTDPACMSFPFPPTSSVSCFNQFYPIECNDDSGISMTWVASGKVVSSSILQVNINATSPIPTSCESNFGMAGGSLVVVLSEVDPTCDVPKLWCTEAIYTNTDGSSTIFNSNFNGYGINR